MDVDVCVYFFVRKENNKLGGGGKGVYVDMLCIYVLLYRREFICKNVIIYNVYV